MKAWIIKIWNLIFSNDNESSHGKVVTNPAPTTPRPNVERPETTRNGQYDVALVRCHNRLSQGAETYDKKLSEWEMYGLVLPLVKDKLSSMGWTSKIIERPSGVDYTKECSHVKSEARPTKAKLGFLGHFNSMNYEVFGSEVLVLDTPTEIDNFFGDLLTNKLESKFGIKQRGDDGVKTISNHNGSGMLAALRSLGITSILAECAFLNKETSESRAILNDLNGYAGIIADSIDETLIEMGHESAHDEQTPYEVNHGSSFLYSPKGTMKDLIHDLAKMETHPTLKVPYTMEMKIMNLSQWILESGRASSELSIQANNFGGLKWRNALKGFATKFWYTDWDNKSEFYCKFDDEKQFIKGYWKFIGRSVYSGWEQYANEPEQYLRFLVKRGYCTNKNYTQKVLALQNESRTLLEAAIND